MTALARLAAAAIIGFGLILQYWLIMTGEVVAADLAPGALWRTVMFFSFFTILTNILAALAFTLPVLAPASRAGRFFARAPLRAALLCYALIVGAVYILVLRRLWDPQGAQYLADLIVHYFMPAVVIADWLFLSTKNSLTMKHALLWLVFPFAFGGWSLLHGAMTGFYPYPFMDAGKLGAAQVVVNLAGLLGLFLVIGLLIVALGHRLDRH